ncbi:MAG: hypothetical protein ABW169_12440 [Sphingobium sp.]
MIGWFDEEEGLSVALSPVAVLAGRNPAAPFRHLSAILRRRPVVGGVTPTDQRPVASGGAAGLSDVQPRDLSTVLGFGGAQKRIAAGAFGGFDQFRWHLALRMSEGADRHQRSRHSKDAEVQCRSLRAHFQIPAARRRRATIRTTA